LCILDLHKKQTVTPELLFSAQDFTPFVGVNVTGWPTAVILRGRVVCANSKVSVAATGKYLRRPFELYAR
jgi:dihydropyrimidinase